ncbi:MAG TPA: hypothetical protein VFG93_00415 [Gaiellaceae bacterium]|nr:hypothetical protein [Gaiellaceae bacterium]
MFEPTSITPARIATILRGRSAIRVTGPRSSARSGAGIARELDSLEQLVRFVGDIDVGVARHPEGCALAGTT